MDCLYIVTTSARSYLSASSYFVKAYPKTLLIILTLISFQTLGQNYEEMSSDVQFKMDQNKIEGKDLLDGIFTDFIVHAEGLSNDELTSLIDRSKKNSDIVDLKIESNEKIIITCKAGVSFDRVKPIFSELVSNISSLELIYFLNKK
jgi:hypothetical protein